MQTTRTGLQERQDAPQVLTSSAESFNATSLNTSRQAEGTKPCSHGVSGYNSRKRDSISGHISKHSVFVLDVRGKPLTPCKPSKARKMLKGGVAKPVWNKFGMFGIQMLVETGHTTPQTTLGSDLGTKFEGRSVVVGKENVLNVMWKLPDKKKIVKKLEDRRVMRRARRFRNCRRRACRSDNREKKEFIAPSQNVIFQSREKCDRELFRCYPITDVAEEDVRFDHAHKNWGKNFSTVEIGKKRRQDWLRKQANLYLYLGSQTPDIREGYGYKKSSSKSAEVFNAHCSDALALALDAHRQSRVEPGPFIVVDDTYRPVRRKLHDAQFSKGGIRYPYSTGNFKGIRKGTMCRFGQICGGTKNTIFVRDWVKRNGKAKSKVTWLSHGFKTSRFLSALKNVSIRIIKEQKGDLKRISKSKR